MWSLPTTQSLHRSWRTNLLLVHKANWHWDVVLLRLTWTDTWQWAPLHHSPQCSSCSACPGYSYTTHPLQTPPSFPLSLLLAHLWRREGRWGGEGNGHASSIFYHTLPQLVYISASLYLCCNSAIPLPNSTVFFYNNKILLRLSLAICWYFSMGLHPPPPTHTHTHIIVTFPRWSSMSQKDECCSVCGM